MRRTNRAWSVLIALAGFAIAFVDLSAAEDLSSAQKQGLELLKQNCLQCHAVDKVSNSPDPAAPPFRNLYEKYPFSSLRLPLKEGVLRGHPSMPHFQFSPEDVENIISYLGSLEE
ncbi:MAG TPA: cytochrome c [Xanthobacteraceae bacterium]|nr:cytochrome c [Xanthobacteraceae bacterium]